MVRFLKIMIVQRSPLKRVSDLPLDEFFIVLFVEVHVMADGKLLGRFYVAELTLITVRALSTLKQSALFHCVAAAFSRSSFAFILGVVPRRLLVLWAGFGFIHVSKPFVQGLFACRPHEIGVAFCAIVVESLAL